MSTTSISLNSYTNGQATNLTSIKLQDELGTYGLKRTDDDSVVIASGTVFDTIATGQYRKSFTDPAAGLTYSYVIRIITGGVTYYYPRTILGNSNVTHIYAIPTSSYYSSQAEVMRMLGDLAVQMMLEDWENSDSSPVWNNILSFVDETIDRELGQRYSRSSLINNAFVRRRATYLAANQLSTRRGNPGLYMRQVDQIMDELADIRANITHVMGATPLGRFMPAVRNYQMQPMSYHPQRVIQTKSTGESYPGQDISWEPYFMTVP